MHHYLIEQWNVVFGVVFSTRQKSTIFLIDNIYVHCYRRELAALLSAFYYFYSHSYKIAWLMENQRCTPSSNQLLCRRTVRQCPALHCKDTYNFQVLDIFFLILARYHSYLFQCKMVFPNWTHRKFLWHFKDLLI